MTPLIVSGSARADGDIALAVKRLSAALGRSHHINLAAERLRPFAYEAVADNDRFRAIIAAMSETDRIILATPVYWYSMSGIMKNFFDRLTDILLDPAKRPLGRSLAGRKLWLVATGADPLLPEGFEVPFRMTADYFGMEWRDLCYLHCASGEPPALRPLDAFAAGILAV